MKWVIYALGNGWGHLNRTLSLGRAIIALDSQNEVIIITNSSYVEKVNPEGCHLVKIPQKGNLETIRNLSRHAVLSHLKPKYDECTFFIVDTFPRGLGGELTDILPNIKNIPRILIHRDINPDYVASKNLIDFVSRNYEGIIIPGEGDELPFSNLPNVKHTHPWLIRHDWELESIIASPKNFLKKKLAKADKSVTTVLVCAGGKVSELSFFGELTQKLNQAFPECIVRVLAATPPPGCCSSLWISHHPGIECIASADIVIGGGGYNTVYECAALNVPLIAIAWKRIYDLQDKRIARNHNSYAFTDINDGFDALKMLLREVTERPIRHDKSVPRYKNGVLEAIDYIQKQSFKNNI